MLCPRSVNYCFQHLMALMSSFLHPDQSRGKPESLALKLAICQDNFHQVPQSKAKTLATEGSRIKVLAVLYHLTQVNKTVSLSFFPNQETDN